MQQIGDRQGEVEHQLARYAERVDTHADLLDSLHDTVHGDGDGAGLKGRLALVEDVAVTFKRVYWLMFAGVLGLLGNLIWEIVTKAKHTT